MKALLASVFFIAFGFSSYGQCDSEVYVDHTAIGSNDGSSWLNAFTDLQDALSCDDAHKIHVAEGTYYPTSGTSRSASFSMKNDVEILGGYPNAGGTRAWEENLTILSGDIGAIDDDSDNSYHVISNNNLESSAVLDGFTIAKGQANSGPNGHSGAGMKNSLSHPTIKNCVFLENRALLEGGGMYNLTSSPSIINCRFLENSAGFEGGGLYNGNGNPILIGCNFTNNHAEDGGGIYNFKGVPTLTSCTVANNFAKMGAGMYIHSGSSANLNGCSFNVNIGDIGGAIYCNNSNTNLTNCSFYDNSSEEGGALAFTAANSTKVDNCIFIGNNAKINGGAIYVSLSSVPFINCLFRENTADVTGGAVRNSGSRSSFVNCTFAQNDAIIAGGAISNYASNITITNSIIWENSKDGNTTQSMANIVNIENSIPIISYSLVGNSGGSSSWNTDLGTDGGNNIDADPLFETPNLFNNELNKCSPAKNIGNNDANSSITDMAGNPRILEDVIDLGAFESQESCVTSVNEMDGTEILSVSPNPTSNEVYIQYNQSEAAPLSFSIIDVSGRRLYESEETISLGNNEMQINMSMFPTGLYFLKINNGNGQLTQRIFKQ